MPIQFIYKKWQDDSIAYAWWQAMHTRIDIVFYGSHSENHLKTVAYKLEKELQELEKTGSYFNESGELYLLNKSKNSTPVLVTNELYSIISSCVDYYQKTLGYFDISIKSDNLNNCAMQYIELDPNNKSVCFKQAGIRLDLSGYLKGCGLEKIRNILAEYDIRDALVNMGNSSILALGNHPHGDGWKIKYNTQTGNEDTEVLLKNECFTTSGNETAGRKHIINPHTGCFIEGKKHVSVITPTGTEGEALSTALFAANAEDHEKILSNFPYATSIV
ncbi:FAD:protein FMN transferase [Bacteroides sp. 519]|uniref:FAD:protein FMN transferase n=1 Tax=Bacteroides sp. 519 TaxID=2302937 RepID=UPI0013D2923B|nr:FAD:protein FMN transferase [Bacteroides sp. 519]NDV58344.1 FAD:protein FMN transferase [Bacteroides sp. 519]